MIKPILITILSFLLFYSVIQYNRTRPVSLAMVLIATTGIVFVAFPEFSTRVAHVMGVGRGADLVIYLISVITLGAVFNLHLRQRGTMETITKLTREIAITQAVKPSDRP